MKIRKSFNCCFANGVPFSTMDELRYYRYFYSKTVDFSELPPTSHSLQAHLLRCCYNCYIQLHCLSDSKLDPLTFGYELDDSTFISTKLHRILPESLPLPCACKKCATRNCNCHRAGVPCCIYCGCRQQNYDFQGTLCKNTMVISLWRLLLVVRISI